jgi:broad specificity phosphatase PhoE
LGLQQARTIVTKLASSIPANVKLVSSPLARARETAQPLAEQLGLAVEYVDAFREIPAPVPLAERRSWLGRFMGQCWEEQPPSLLEWRELAIETTLGQQAPTVIFTHFMVINAIVGAAQGRSETVLFQPDNGSITRRRKLGSGLEIVDLGHQMATVVN